MVNLQPKAICMKQIVTILLMLTGFTVHAQQLVSENVFKDITKLADVRQNRFTRPSPAGKTRKSGKPVAFYIGDSTMRNGTAGNGWNGEWGFGLFVQQWFDADRLVVENHALGGTSSRTYYNYEWPTVKQGIQEGDYVVIAFGHNDGGSNWDTKSVIGGTSATDTRVVTNNKGVEETVYSFGQYMRMFIDEVRALGATPILCSRTPRGSFSNGKLGMDTNYRQWGKTVAEEKGVSYIDLEGVANPIYNAYGEWKTTQLYRNGTLHTSLLGAWHNAYCAALAIAADEQNPLHQYLLDTTPPRLPVSRTAGKACSFTIGGSDMSARLAFNSGRWDLVYNTLETGDTVRFAFGDNELKSMTDNGEMGCIQSANDSQEMKQMSATSRWELVGSYGWYVHYFLNDCKEKGAVAVLVTQDGTTPDVVAEWNEQLASEYNVVLSRLDTKGLPKVPSIGGGREYLTRGVVALPAPNGRGIFVSWRLLGTDPIATTTFDVLRDGKTIARNLNHQTNYTDTEGTSTNTYQVVTKVEGSVVETTDAVTPWPSFYRNIRLDRPQGGILPWRDRTYNEEGKAIGWTDYADKPYTYHPQECSVGDVDGDGEYELFVIWRPTNAQDNSFQYGKTGNVYIDCYRLDGTKLWRIDLGMNIRAGDHYTQPMVYDFDGDGRVELICKTAPGSKDAQGVYVNQAADEVEIRSADNTQDFRIESGKIVGGQEYLTVFDGMTGRAIHTVFYNPNRDTGYGGEAPGNFNWDDRSGKSDYASYGNRGERYLACVAYLDGTDKQPSAVMCRGYYTYAFLWAVNFDGSKLGTKWFHASRTKNEVERTGADGVVETRQYTSNTFGTSDSYTAYGQGNHNLSVADVDGDGYDEILYGAATIDHDGWMLYTTGLGHGDAMHVSDLMPDRPGLEVYRCMESSPYGVAIYDAATGEKIYHDTSSKDTGRCMAADVMPEYRGFEFWGANGKKLRETASGNFEQIGDFYPSQSFRVYWDGDVQDELIENAVMKKWNGSDFVELKLEGKNFQEWDNCGQGGKGGASIQADLFGDWREEIICWNQNDSTSLNVFTTNIPSNYRVPTLMHDHVYRLCVAWQNVAYNQPPHLSYYLPDAVEGFQADEVTTPDEPQEVEKNVLLSYDFETGAATDYWKRGNGYLVTPTIDGTTGRVASVTSGSDRADYFLTPANLNGLKTYSVDLDLAITKGNKTAYFAVMSQSASDVANNWGWFWVTTSAEVHNPYLFELTIPGGTTATVNEKIVDGQTERGNDGTWSFTSQKWYHLTLDVDVEQASVTYAITDKSTEQKVLDGTYMLRQGESALIKGIYERNNRNAYDPGAIMIDNVIISTTETVSTGITTMTPRRTSSAIYDLQGRRLSRVPQKGVYIVGGKKVVKQ